ncbi:MAG: hypothetical protein AAF738_01445 [Bacteroidota bacterium]
MALLCTYSLGQRLKTYQQQSTNYRSLQQGNTFGRCLLRGVLVALVPLAAAIILLPNAAHAQCNPAFPKSFNLASSSSSKSAVVESSPDYDNILLDVNSDGNIDFVLQYTATSSGEDFLRQLSISPYGDQGNGFIHDGDYVANLKQGAKVPGAGPFVSLEIANSKILYLEERKDGKKRCEGFCEGEGNVGIVVNRGQYGFLNISLDVASAQKAKVTINSGGVHPELNKIVKAKCTDLPYQLPFFQARPSTSTVAVAWAPEDVENLYGMELQRSTDNQYFYKIDWKGTLDLTASEKFLFTDSEVIVGKTYYYRVKRVHQDGTFSYSTAVNAALITRSADNTPAIGKLEADNKRKVATLQVDAPEATTATLIILNNERVAVKTIASDLKVGHNELVVSTSELQSGIYFVKIEVAGKRSYRKLEIK